MNFNQILSLFGGITVVSTSLATFFSYLILNKLKINWKKNADIEIEKAIAKMDKNREEIMSIFANFSQIHNTSQKKRIEAVEILWKNTLEIRELNDSAVFFYNIIPPKEYNKSSNNQLIKNLINRIPEKEDLAYKIKEINGNVDRYRPFLNEYLWGLFSLYGSFSTRLSLQLKLSYEYENNDIKKWYKDEAINTFLNTVFDSKELDSFNFDSLYTIRMIIDRFEEKILKESSKLISGDFATQESIKQSKKIKKALDKVDTFNDKI